MSSEFKEWKSCLGLLEKIPEKYHKNWIPYDLNLTCIAAHDQFIALGTNIGLVYWYERLKGKLYKLICADRRTSISQISLLDTVDFMLAAGNDAGILAIFQIPKMSSQTLLATTSEGGTDCFHIEDVHRHKISSLEWSVNGQRLFAADVHGLVSVTNVDYSLRKSSTFKLCQLNSFISQLSYSKGTLLISSLDQSYFCYPDSSTESDAKYSIVGGKPRQIIGAYGGIISPPSSHYSKEIHARILRPNWMIASASTSKEGGGSGEIMSKVSFKSRLKEPHPEIKLLHPFKGGLHKMEYNNDAHNILHLGESLLIYNSASLHILRIEGNQVMNLSSCQYLKSILDVSVSSKKEIFILENSRSVIRLASFEDEKETDAVLSNDPSVSSVPEGGPGLETLSNFFSNSGKKLFNRFPQLKKLGDIGELVLGEVDTGEDANEETFLNLRHASVENISSESSSPDESEDEATIPLQESSLTEENEDKLLEALNLNEFISSSSLPPKKTTHPNPLVHMSIDAPIALIPDESSPEEDSSIKGKTISSLSIEIRKDTMKEFPNWIRFSGPGQNIKNLAASSKFVLIQDDCDRCFVSYYDCSFKSWVLLQNFGPWNRISVSGDGSIIWRLHESIAYALRRRNNNEESLCQMESFNWKKISEPGINDIHVKEFEGYLLDGKNNTLIKHSNLSSSSPFDPRHFVVRPIPEDLREIVTVSGDVLYAMDHNQVLACPLESDTTSTLLNGRGETPANINCIAISKTLTSIKIILMDKSGMLYFSKDNGTKWYWSNPRFLLGSKQLRRVNDSLWISNQSQLYLNKEDVPCAFWEEIIQRVGGDIKTISVEAWDDGGRFWVARGDEDSQSLHAFDPDKKHLAKIKVPRRMSNKIAAISSYGASTWILDNDGAIYTREGNNWSPLDLTQLSSMNVKLRHLSLGANIVWALDEHGGFYMRPGPHSLEEKEDFLPAWIAGDPEYGEQLEPLRLVKIYASNNEDTVWAIDDGGNIYHRSGISNDFRLGTRWIRARKPSSGSKVLQLALGGEDSEVWALSSEGHIYKRVSKDEDSWIRVPGEKAACIGASAHGCLFKVCDEGIFKESRAKFETIE